MNHHDQVRTRLINVGERRGEGRAIKPCQHINRRRSHGEYKPRILSHLNDAPAARLGSREVNMGKFRDSVAHALVNGPGYIAAFMVRDRYVEIGRGECRRHHLKAVSVDKDHVGLEALQLIGDTHDADADRLCHCPGRSPVKKKRHAGMNRKSLARDVARERIIPRKDLRKNGPCESQRPRLDVPGKRRAPRARLAVPDVRKKRPVGLRGCGHDLQLQPRVVADAGEHRTQAPEMSPKKYRHQDFLSFLSAHTLRSIGSAPL